MLMLVPLISIQPAGDKLAPIAGQPFGGH